MEFTSQDNLNLKHHFKVINIENLQDNLSSLFF